MHMHRAIVNENIPVKISTHIIHKYTSSDSWSSWDTVLVNLSTLNYVKTAIIEVTHDVCV